MQTVSEGPILFFDGVCNLCNSTVQFVLKNDKRKRLRFASLQSSAGQKVGMQLASIYGSTPDSLVLQHKGKLYIKSDAALHVARLLGGFWPLLSIFLIVPRFIRNAVYDYVAKNRYKWFGKRDECMMPTKELKERFI